jgi:hypothetical protein
MATDKLSVYNSALIHLEERRITSLTENREPRRVLDAIWDKTVKFCLERGQWNFALKSSELASSASVDPTFGYTYAFEKPDDWVRLTKISASDQLEPSLLRYSEEGDYWYADVDPLYIQYVSSDTDYGFDLGKWSFTFEEYVAIRLAFKAAGRLSGKDALKADLFKMERQARTEARSIDAQNQGTSFAPTGSWVQSRGGGLSVTNGRRYLRG